MARRKQGLGKKAAKRRKTQALTRYIGPAKSSTELRNRGKSYQAARDRYLKIGW